MSAIPVSQQSCPVRSVSLDLSKAAVASESLPAIDLFEFPASSQASSVDLFQPSILSSTPSNKNQPSRATQSSSVDFFADVSNNASTFDIPKNEGWATFDIPQHAAPTAQVPAGVPSTDKSLLDLFDPFSTANASKPWSSFDTSGVHEPSTTSNSWHGGLQNGEQASITAANAQVSIL